MNGGKRMRQWRSAGQESPTMNWVLKEIFAGILPAIKNILYSHSKLMNITQEVKENRKMITKLQQLVDDEELSDSESEEE